MDLFNSKYILSNKRFAWIDYDRGISIILVTYRHCFESIEKFGADMKQHPILEYINVFFFGFRMPLFFIASGIFVSSSLRKRGIGTYAENRVQTILYPMLLWGILQLGLQMLMSDHTNSQITPEYFLYLITEPRKTGQFWYLNALFFVGIIYATLRTYLKFKTLHQVVLGLGLYFFAYYLRLQEQNWGFAMDIFKYYLFFSIGDLISDRMLTEKAMSVFSSWKMVVPLLIGFIVVQYFFTTINMQEHYNAAIGGMDVSNYFVENNMPLFFIVVALVGCAFSISVSFSLSRFGSLKFIRVVGYHSVYIYCMQIIAMGFARIILTKFFGITNVPLLVILVLAAGLTIPVITYQLAVRAGAWWLFTLKKPVEEMEYLSKKKEAGSPGSKVNA